MCKPDLKIEYSFITVHTFPISFKAFNRLIGHRMCNQRFEHIRRYRNAVASAERTTVNLFGVFKACGKNLAIQAVYFKLLNDFSNNVCSVTQNVVQSIHIRRNKIRACLCRH